MRPFPAGAAPDLRGLALHAWGRGIRHAGQRRRDGWGEGRSAMFLGADPDEPGEGGKSGNEKLFPAVPLAYPGFSHYLCMQLEKSSTRRENIIYM